MPAGRPALGRRRQVNVRLPVDLVTAIDNARGIVSRDSWIEKAAKLALEPTSAYANPELKQRMHKHVQGNPLRTDWVDGERVRYYECRDCGLEFLP